MAVDRRELSRRWSAKGAAGLGAVKRRLLVASDPDLEPAIRMRLRTAHFEATTRHSLLMLLGNLFNAIVIVAVAVRGPHGIAAIAWGAALLLLLSPALSRWTLTRASRPVSQRTLIRLVRNAGLLGAFWGLAPLLFIGSGPDARLVVGMVTAGMLCGGAFGLAAIPLAVIAYVLPLGLGYVAAQSLSHNSTSALVAALTIGYVAVLIGAALSYGREFAETTIARARAECAARHDPVTGLFNRVALDATLAESLARLERYGEPFAVISIRFDELKALIHQRGRTPGEEWLRQAAVRLRDAVDERGVLARIGDDHFSVVTRIASGAQDAPALVAEIASRFEKAFVLEGGLAFCQAAVGVALAPDDGKDAETLLAKADAKMSAQPGERGPAPSKAPPPGRPPRRRELSLEMRSSLSRGEFFLQYQPVQTTRNGRVEAFEALARWRHPTLGLIPPMEFIDIAEKSGLIHDLGEWIVNEALREAAGWSQPARIAVNVSGEQLCDNSFKIMFERALAKSGIDPQRVQIEVTESASLAGADKAVRVLEELAARGIEIVLDDFGVGYSSLVQIGRLPVKRLKIDRGFVAGLPLSRSDAAVVETVIGLARALDFAVTAEGVETEAQRAYLALAGVDSTQGYLISRPLMATDASALLMRQKPARSGLAA